MKKLLSFLLLLCASTSTTAQTDLMSDTWVATDALGRTMPTCEEVGDMKTGHPRKVGIFYITWHTQNLHSLPGPYTDVTKILQEDPSARMQHDHPLWRYGTYHWGEPEAGYFLSQDEWLIRRDLSMLQDAGVDVLILDVTNGVLYWDEWEMLFKTMEQMRREGNQTPQFTFWSYNGNPVSVVTQLYERYYKPGRYRDLWFQWESRPLLLYNARPEYDANGSYDTSADAYPKEIFSFFTLRNMWWGYYEWYGQRYIGTEDNWSFGYSMADPHIINMSPRELVSRHKGQPEEAAVTPAQHPVTMTDKPMGVGKSWSRQYGEPPLNDRDMPTEAYVPWLDKTVSETAGDLAKAPTAYGIYFQERWNDALQADPPFIYLNDWNEWTAGKYFQKDSVGWLGRKNPFMFVDQYNAEFNRTIQPMKGGYTDNYYMQMAQNIRRYKGARPIPKHTGKKKITVDGRFDDWQAVAISYRDTRGDTFHRHAKGYAGLVYTDTTGRNDIIETKVAVSRKRQVCFYVRTAEALTPSGDPNWMLLLIDADHEPTTGWYGYDLLVKPNPASTRKNGGSVLRYSEGHWEQIGYVSSALNGNEMELRLPAKMLNDNSYAFDFKWADNPSDLDNPISLCIHGDTAPNRRFNYRFLWTAK